MHIHTQKRNPNIPLYHMASITCKQELCSKGNAP